MTCNQYLHDARIKVYQILKKTVKLTQNCSTIKYSSTFPKSLFLLKYRKQIICTVMLVFIKHGGQVWTEFT
jgi:hypothetical protein